jgi:YVTN family beta-propeller protein
MHNYLFRDESSSGEPRQRGVWRHLCGVIMALLVVGASYSTAGAQTQPRPYVANRCNNTVSVIDTATNTVIATIAGVACPAGIAIATQG